MVTPTGPSGSTPQPEGVPLTPKGELPPASPACAQEMYAATEQLALAYYFLKQEHTSGSPLPYYVAADATIYWVQSYEAFVKGGGQPDQASQELYALLTTNPDDPNCKSLYQISKSVVQDPLKNWKQLTAPGQPGSLVESGTYALLQEDVVHWQEVDGEMGAEGFTPSFSSDCAQKASKLLKDLNDYKTDPNYAKSDRNISQLLTDLNSFVKALNAAPPGPLTNMLLSLFNAPIFNISNAFRDEYIKHSPASLYEIAYYASREYSAPHTGHAPNQYFGEFRKALDSCLDLFVDAITTALNPPTFDISHIEPITPDEIPPTPEPEPLIPPGTVLPASSPACAQAMYTATAQLALSFYALKQESGKAPGSTMMYYVAADATVKWVESYEAFVKKGGQPDQASQDIYLALTNKPSDGKSQSLYEISKAVVENPSENWQQLSAPGKTGSLVAPGTDTVLKNALSSWQKVDGVAGAVGFTPSFSGTIVDKAKSTLTELNAFKNDPDYAKSDRNISLLLSKMNDFVRALKSAPPGPVTNMLLALFNAPVFTVSESMEDALGIPHGSSASLADIVSKASSQYSAGGSNATKFFDDFKKTLSSCVDVVIDVLTMSINPPSAVAPTPGTQTTPSEKTLYSATEQLAACLNLLTAEIGKTTHSPMAYYAAASAIVNWVDVYNTVPAADRDKVSQDLYTVLAPLYDISKEVIKDPINNWSMLAAPGTPGSKVPAFTYNHLASAIGSWQKADAAAGKAAFTPIASYGVILSVNTAVTGISDYTANPSDKNAQALASNIIALDHELDLVYDQGNQAGPICDMLYDYIHAPIFKSGDKAVSLLDLAIDAGKGPTQLKAFTTALNSCIGQYSIAINFAYGIFGPAK
ncbi:MAG: hypothetical protein JSS61_05460 [Verrucomicrobia bacterium]|nr:hypothetical protein [Verrucomicrobiota bacterium]